MDARQVKAIRERTLHSTSPLTAQYGQMSFDELRRFISGSYEPTEDQLGGLARYFGLQEPVQ